MPEGIGGEPGVAELLLDQGPQGMAQPVRMEMGDAEGSGDLRADVPGTRGRQPARGHGPFVLPRRGLDPMKRAEEGSVRAARYSSRASRARAVTVTTRSLSPMPITVSRS